MLKFFARDTIPLTPALSPRVQGERGNSFRTRKLSTSNGTRKRCSISACRRGEELARWRRLRRWRGAEFGFGFFSFALRGIWPSGAPGGDGCIADTAPADFSTSAEAPGRSHWPAAWAAGRKRLLLPANVAS